MSGFAASILCFVPWLLVPTVLTAAESSPYEVDVCIYGGTSGGVVAAIQAARMGQRVVLVEPGRHLGGMTSGGLSAVDIGDPRSVGGIAREYFTRLVESYGKKLQWDQPFRGQGGPATGGAYSIEPHVAEQVFDKMASEAGVIVLRDARLKSLKKEGQRIRELQADDGRIVRAKMFIDATYEGDLMPPAGVSYTVTREGNAKYGETYNGIYYSPKYKPRTNHKKPGANGRVPGGQGVWDRDFPLDPYIVKGDPSSGLLPLVNEGDPGHPGEPAPGIQAYCFRLCLTTEKSNQIPIAPPPDYDAKRYELVARFVEACLANGDDMDLRWFSKHDPLPNHKWDFNTATFGANLPGASWEWPEASYQQRSKIAKEIENYHRGLLHFLATDSRVPEKVRREIKRFGLPKDEFTDNGGWPHQIYIREGRRMVSDLVMTEHHTFGRKTVPRSIGLGSYGTDAHEIRRIVKDGVVTREGKIATGRGGFGPYQIGYGAIVPKRSECENLLVTFALSASHSAFASIRMEPVFMVTSQSAATAACLAIDGETAVQKVDYDKLRKRLLADDQVLDWSPSVSASWILVNGNLVTMDQRKPRAEAIAIDGDRILAVGTNAEIRTLAGPKTKVLDLQGRLTIPGFIEGHGHFLSLGRLKQQLDLTKATSWQEIVQQVAAETKRHKPGTWIVGRGWHQEKWQNPPEHAVGGYPSHEALSQVSPDHPVLLVHASGHASLANAKAMELAGVDAKTPDPAGGKILRDDKGRPMGVFRETAQDLIHRAHQQATASQSPAQDKAQLRAALQFAAQECLAKGITSFQDAGSRFADVDFFREQAEAGQLPVRLWVMLRASNAEYREKLANYRIVDAGDSFLTVRAIKCMADGALGSHGALFLEPYRDLPESTGHRVQSLPTIQETALLAAKHNFQLCTHAIGDRANRDVLDVYQTIFRTYPNKTDWRWRIEHAQHLHPMDIPRFGEMGIIASMQANHCTSDAPFVIERLGEQRAKTGAYAWRSLLDSGAKIVNGTDAPVEDVNPLGSFYAAITRRPAQAKPFYPEQCLTRREALKNYTLDAAYAAFEDDQKGSLTPGKLADLVVLSQDILTIPAEEISKTQVDLTIVGGKVVYRHKSIPASSK